MTRLTIKRTGDLPCSIRMTPKMMPGMTAAYISSESSRTGMPFFLFLRMISFGLPNGGEVSFVFSFI